MSIRDDLRREIEETRTAFHRLVDEVPEEALSRPSDNPAWTIGEVLYHMSLAPRLMVADVSMITGERQAYRLLPKLIPQALFDWVNKVYTRSKGRNLSHRELIEAYDQATVKILQVLESVGKEDFEKRAVYPGWDPLLAGEVTLAQLFHYVKAHFEVHEGQIRHLI
ncbi:MAG: maleylpyruvate isomerase N-terminal domain-containing protein [Anaerolineae bacterium]|nr:maleylpyruvate isomerase N-terminal domain-containing protein [Anaerolineae bacterium]